MLLDPLHFQFEAKRGDGQWRLQRFACTETMSQVYHCELTLHHPDFDADLENLLGSSCSTTLLRGGQPHKRLCGVIYRVERLGAAENHLLARVEVAPALTALTQTQNSRIFQKTSAIDIVRSVLNEGLAPYERSCRLELKRKDYAVREYCVQYGETDYDFVRRLLREEGVAFYFDHSGTTETMVLVDANSVFPLHASPYGDSIPLIPADAGVPSEEAVQVIKPQRALRPTSGVFRDYDWRQPNMPVHYELHEQDTAERERLIYDSAPALCLEANWKDCRVRLENSAERDDLEGWLLNAEGNVAGFAPGCRFDLHDRLGGVHDGRYLVTGVVHRGTAPSAFAGDEADACAYHNEFMCLPEKIPYRPYHEARRPVVGVQTATVVGPAGEEIYTNENGQIKVQFHWDRKGQRNEHSSCWLRVMQVWAGAGFGALFVPRIGMEVVVQFLEGNADRPIVIGCVYNGLNLTTVPLPQEKTKSGFTTRSSPGGVGYNELIFEDACGHEEISIHAQKDLRSKVLHDQSVDVGHDDALSVGNNQTIKIGVQQGITVGADRSLTVGGNETISVAKDEAVSIGANEQRNVGADRMTAIGGNDASAIAASRTTAVAANDKLAVSGHQTTTIGSKKVESVGGLSLENVGGAKTLSVGGAYAVNVGAAMNTMVMGIATEEAGFLKIIKAGSKIELCCGASKITLSKSGEITIEGKKSVKIVGGVIDLN